jgi:uncharacterized protein (DUF433 family)
MVQLSKLLERITVNPAVQHGKPCVRGTRTPVYVVLENLATGMTPQELCREYPPLTEEDIRACVSFAALLANEEEVIPPSTSRP